MRFSQEILTRLNSFADVDRVVRNLSLRIKELTAVRILRGRLIEDIEIGTTTKAVPHGLGVTPVGVIIVKKPVAVHIYHHDFNRKTFSLRTSVSSTSVSVWVF